MKNPNYDPVLRDKIIRLHLEDGRIIKFGDAFIVK